MVIIAVPNWAEGPAEKRSEAIPDPGVGIVGGVNCAVTPAGSPEADSDTAEENPPEDVELTCNELLMPLWSVMLLGVAAIAKSGTGTPLIV